MKAKFLNANNQIKFLFTSQFRKTDEVTGIIKSCGYKGELYQVKSDDGYILSIHRIRSRRNIEVKGTAFLMHGLFRNSADFIATGPNVALPYLLADHGYDVFLGNARGTKYSTEHVKHSYKSSEFWNFSWHEIGYFDLPAMIEYALDKTDSSKVYYVGHSQGCSSILALLSTRPSFNSMLSQVHLMAPSVFMNHSTSPVFRIGSRTFMRKFTSKMDKFDISPFLDLANKIRNLNNKNPEVLMKIYKTITCRLIGKNQGEVQLSPEAIKTFNHFMSPIVSVKQLNHYIQLYKSGKFQRYDHGKHNDFYYGTMTPPEYQLNNVIVPSYLYHAERDTLVVKEGVDQLAKSLPNVQNYEIVPDFNHIDVMLGRDARKLLYENILGFMNKM